MNILIAGTGTMLIYLTQRFHSQGHRVSLLVADAREAESLSQALKATVYHGDATNPEVLADIWTESVDMLLALTPRDHDNLGICRMASLHFNVPRAFALASNPANVQLFHELDVEAFSPTPLVAQMIEQRSVTDAVRSMNAIANGKLLVTELTVGAQDAIAEQTLATAGLPQEILIASIMRGNEHIIPKGDTTVFAGDCLTVISTPQMQSEVLRRLTEG
ncbi:MAG: NAD-binding protein [Bacteroidetes bacterium]|nr:NAD-binding protein [Bacteroidota bacterium]